MLFGIKKISWCYWDELTCSSYSRGTGQCSMPTNTMKEVCLVSQKQATISIQTSDQSRVRMHTAEVRFMTEQTEDLHSSRPKCYLVETVDGPRFIVGGKERPFCIVTEDYKVGSTPTDISGTSFVVSYKSAQPILKVVV